MDERPLPVCVFLPGIIAPAVVRYAPLIGALGTNARAHTKELELYTASPPPGDYAIADELEGLSRSVRRAGLNRFHLYGHSGGGAVALAFTATHPELVTEEPAQAMPRLMRLELKPGVEFAPPAGGAPPLPNRPAGIAALLRAFERHTLDTDALRGFQGHVLYTRGSLSADRYERSANRLAAIFPDFREIVFDGLHHLNTSHQAEPARVAGVLLDLWSARESP
ncbi:MAG: hypothetical protein HOQ28_01350 [Thermoleophilia bacterium]|nr:hypothetical protein [Thermoleophilia bacterium]